MCVCSTIDSSAVIREERKGKIARILFLILSPGLSDGERVWDKHVIWYVWLERAWTKSPRASQVGAEYKEGNSEYTRQWPLVGTGMLKPSISERFAAWEGLWRGARLAAVPSSRWNPQSPHWPSPCMYSALLLHTYTAFPFFEDSVTQWGGERGPRGAKFAHTWTYTHARRPVERVESRKARETPSSKSHHHRASSAGRSLRTTSSAPSSSSSARPPVR